ncbi:MAG: porin family protein [Oligoflexia bacterium]|nr:porin family protein [Oligoflexia bacterium]
MNSLAKLLRLLAPCALLFCAPAQASSSFNFRQMNSIGAWNGSLSQTDAAGHSLSARTLTSLGVELGFGLDFGLFFADYNFTWFLANHTLGFGTAPNAYDNPSTREGPYFAPFGLNVGVSLPMIPIDPYLGIERGSFNFSKGANTSYSGLAAKIGVNAKILPRFGLRAEYRKHYFTSDDAGTLPGGIKTRFTTWYLGIVGGRF